ncbi:MAG TPA: type II toxin-antitoxin system VapC family toxin [Verrucomicrobiae bacterium]|nr:type II toxin-antitoxin system VapC family toxin [Verrucomicrobiae bacterium]
MTYLLDTHVLLWAVNTPARIEEAALAQIESGENVIFYSAVSIWELCIKAAKGLLVLNDQLLGAIQTAGFVELPVRTAHAWEVKRLPLLHRDPFDRMLVAQAKAQNLVLISRDNFLERYDISVLRG